MRDAFYGIGPVVLGIVAVAVWVAMRGINPAVVGAIALTVVQLMPHAAPDAFTGTLFVLTVARLLLWRLPALPLAVGGGLLGIVARSRFAMRLRDFA